MLPRVAMPGMSFLMGKINTGFLMCWAVLMNAATGFAMRIA